MPPSNLWDVAVLQLCVVVSLARRDLRSMLFTSGYAALAHSILHVVFSSTKEKMIWIETLAVITLVAHL